MFETFVLIRDLVVCRCIYYYVVRVVSMRVREKERAIESVCVVQFGRVEKERNSNE